MYSSCRAKRSGHFRLLPHSGGHDAQAQAGRAENRGKALELWISTPGQRAVERLAVESRFLRDACHFASSLGDIAKRLQQACRIAFLKCSLHIGSRVRGVFQPCEKVRMTGHASGGACLAFLYSYG